MFMTFDDFIRGFNARYYTLTPDEIGSWRYGQILFNALCEARPDISELLRGTELDPFYCEMDDINPSTWTVVAKLW